MRIGVQRLSTPAGFQWSSLSTGMMRGLLMGNLASWHAGSIAPIMQPQSIDDLLLVFFDTGDSGLCLFGLRKMNNVAPLSPRRQCVKGSLKRGILIKCLD